MNLSRALVPAFALCCLLPVACRSTPGLTAEGRAVRAEVASEDEKKPASGEKAAAKEGKEGEDPKKKAEDKADELRKKEHELDYARRGLKLARLDQESAGREAQNAVADAEFELKEALDAREHYRAVESPLKVNEETLGIERAQEYRERQSQELAELEAMYQQEDLATLTKELVLRRSKMDLVLADKALAIENQQLVDLQGHGIPKKVRELEQATVKAEKKLAEAKAKLARHTSSKELELLKAEHSVEDLERAVAKLKTELERAQEKAREAPSEAVAGQEARP
jgi:hypothetical protein